MYLDFLLKVILINQSNKIYSTNKQLRFKTSMLQSNLCGYSGAYIVVTGAITVRGTVIDRKIGL